MGWRTINGRSYYYRSVRVGNRVRSEYRGSGDLARLAEIFCLEDRLERAEWRKARIVMEEQERELCDWFRRGEDVARATMHAAGFHRHKSQWRRKRDG